MDASSAFGDPLLRDEAAGDLSLLTGSPCIDTGIATVVPDDVVGTARPQGSAYDIGAFEYIGVGGVQFLDPPSIDRAFIIV
jgi:hypothetical protein